MEDVTKKQTKKQFQCQECDLAFYHRKGLNIHRSMHESVIVVDVKEETLKGQSCDQYGATVLCGPMYKSPVSISMGEGGKQLENQVDCTYSKLDNLLTRYSTRESKKGRKVFISDQRFDQLAENKQLRKWTDLSHDCIYKLELLYRHDEYQIVAELSNRDGVYQSVILPKFVIDKLLELEQSVMVYLRLMENDDQVSLVAVKKYACANCNIDLSSAKSLWRHRKAHCR